jgi:Bacterial TniB protein
MSEYPHLHPQLIKLLQKSADERVRYVKSDRWIGYTRANDILKKMDDLVTHPRVDRMPNMLLIGRSNNGKSHILERFKKKHAPSENYGGEKIIAPVLGIQSPPGPSDAALYSEILTALYERVPSSSGDARRNRVIEVLREIELKVLVIDELHNLLAGSSTKQQTMFNAIKYLGNTLKISIIGAGTVDLLRAVGTDEQIQNRFKPEALPLWKNDKEFERLVKSIESVMPLPMPSHLTTARMLNKIHAVSEGTIGEISALLHEATIFAINHDEDKITYEALNECGYVSPSDRKVTSEQL